jgi:hypothetical protein
MKKNILKIFNIIVLMLSFAWLVSYFNWEPFIATIISLSTLVGLEMSDKKSLKMNPDVDLFNRLLKDLPTEGSISFISTHDFHNLFDIKELDDLKTFVRHWNDAEHEFLNKKLEKKRRKLLLLIDELYENIGSYIFSDDYVVDKYRIPKEWRLIKPELYNQAAAVLHEASDKVFECHQDLIRQGRKSLKS